MGEFEPATLESQVEHSTTEPKPLLNYVFQNYLRGIFDLKSRIWKNSNFLEKYIISWIINNFFCITSQMQTDILKVHFIFF